MRERRDVGDPTSAPGAPRPPTGPRSRESRCWPSSPPRPAHRQSRASPRAGAPTGVTADAIHLVSADSTADESLPYFLCSAGKRSRALVCADSAHAPERRACKIAANDPPGAEVHAGLELPPGTDDEHQRSRPRGGWPLSRDFAEAPACLPALLAQRYFVSEVLLMRALCAASVADAARFPGAPMPRHVAGGVKFVSPDTRRRGTVLIMLREGDELVVAASAGHVDRAEGHRLPVTGSTSGQVLERGRPQRIEDVSSQLRITPDRLACQTRTRPCSCQCSTVARQ